MTTIDPVLSAHRKVKLHLYMHCCYHRFWLVDLKWNLQWKKIINRYGSVLFWSKWRLHFEASDKTKIHSSRVSTDLSRLNTPSFPMRRQQFINGFRYEKIQNNLSAAQTWKKKTKEVEREGIDSLNILPALHSD